MRRKKFCSPNVLLFLKTFERKKFSAKNKKCPAYIKETKNSRRRKSFTLRVNKALVISCRNYLPGLVFARPCFCLAMIKCTTV